MLFDPRNGGIVRIMRNAVIVSFVLAALSQTALAGLTSPEAFFGHPIGADYQLPNYQKLSAYWKKLDEESDRMKLVEIGKTEEGRPQYMAIVSSEENVRNADKYRVIAEKLCRAKNLTDAEAQQLADEGKAIVWIDGGLHATETLCPQQLMETLWQMVSMEDEETKRIRRDVIILFVHANPDGHDLVADWYMQNAEPTRRMMNIPRLYQKYAGHDNNRDQYMLNLAETRNMSRVLYKEWYPQIMYNHHQSGPRGTVMFVPPFRDPSNHHIDPQVLVGIEVVGLAMHNRFVQENKPGTTMREGAPYSAWWNGGLRTTAMFHNMIALLTETIGNPTPMQIPFVADRLTPQGSMYYPIEPQPWKFRQSVDYSVTANRAVLDYASRYRERLLYGIYQVGKRQIELGSKDTWVDYPSRTAAAKTLADLRKPELRVPRAYVIRGDFPDRMLVDRFVKALEDNGIEVDRYAKSIRVNGKTFAGNTIVVRTNQAFRSHVIDMFEPQDYPNDFPAPGAPPTPPYDSAGYTLAYTMGIPFKRILDTLQIADGTAHVGDAQSSSYIPISMTLNDSRFVGISGAYVSYQLVNQSLKNGQPIFGVATSENSLIWSKSKSELPKVDVSIDGGPHPVLEFQAPRIGLWDTYGGSMASGWMRYVLEQFQFSYKQVYAQEFDAGNLNDKFDTLIFVDGAIRPELPAYRAPRTENIPPEYHSWTGNISDRTLPKLKEFLENGGTIICIGDSISLGKHLGLPVENHLVKDGKALGRTEFYIPGSVMRVKLDQKQIATSGMAGEVDVMFDSAPVMKITGPGVTPIGWFDGKNTLRSGWGWGQQFLDGGVAYASAKVGKGTLYLYGPDVNFRGQTWATFRLLFNPILLSRTKVAN